jgi:hypothetical protein
MPAPVWEPTVEKLRQSLQVTASMAEVGLE